MQINTGVTGNDISKESQRLLFEYSAADLASADLNPGGDNTPANISAEKHIKAIRGTDLDEKGDARSWMFIVEQNGRITIVTYNQQGVTFSSSPGTIKKAEIFPAQIISPRELFNKNRAIVSNTTLSGTTGSLDLTLIDGYYSLTVSGNGTPRNLVFDAKTGALKS